MGAVLDLGVPLGTVQPRRGRGQAIWDDGEGHLITFAPTGAGKGVSCIIPALLSWDGPAVVIDPKGENYAVTAARRRAFGHRVAVFDPFGVTGAAQTDALNPFDLIGEDSPFAADEAAVIARLCSQGKYFKQDPFWDERAETLITGLILFTRYHEPPKLRHLGEVREMVEADPYRVQQLLKDIMRTQSSEIQLASSMLGVSGDHRLRVSIVSTASSHLSFLRAGPVQDSIATSTIDLEDVRLGNKLTAYLVLPPDKLASHGKLLRLWLGTLMVAMGRRRFRPSRPTLLLIDEAAQLGPMDELRAAVTLMRGYGVKCWSFWQDLSQLKQVYPDDWQSLVNNSGVQQYFGVSSPQAARELEEYLGPGMPKPLRQLKPHESLLVRRGHPPVITTLPSYLRDPIYAGLYTPNPFYGPARNPDDLEDVVVTRSDVVVPFPAGGR